MKRGRGLTSFPLLHSLIQLLDWGAHYLSPLSHEHTLLAPPPLCSIAVFQMLSGLSSGWMDGVPTTLLDEHPQVVGPGCKGLH